MVKHYRERERPAQAIDRVDPGRLIVGWIGQSAHDDMVGPLALEIVEESAHEPQFELVTLLRMDLNAVVDVVQFDA
jgi:hypothetical protein